MGAIRKDEEIVLYLTDFLDTVYASPFQAILISLGCLVFYLLLFFRKIKTVTDPLILGVIAHAFGFNAMIIMYVNGNVENEFFIGFLSTEFAFIIGFFLFCTKGGIATINTNCELRLQSNWPLVSALCWANIITVTIFTALYLFRTGLMLFDKTSRLDTLQQLGVVAWFIDIGWVALPASLMIKGKIKGMGAADIFIVALCFFLLLTKGGKSDFLILLFTLGIASIHLAIHKARYYLTLAALLSPLLLMVATAAVLYVWDSELTVFEALIERFLFFGDAFILGYNKSFLDSLPDIGFFEYFFQSIVANIQTILSASVAPNERFVLGFKMYEYYYGVESGIGPNARHNILGLVLFGSVGAIVFSFCCGAIFGILRSRVLILSRSWVFSSFSYILISTFSVFMMIDPSLTAGFFLKIIVYLIFVFLMTKAILFARFCVGMKLIAR